jgi:hypothetical protein
VGGAADEDSDERQQFVRHRILQNVQRVTAHKIK